MDWSSIAGHFSRWTDVAVSRIFHRREAASSDATDFYSVVKRIFVRLDDDPTQGDRNLVYRNARETLKQHLQETGASKEFSEDQNNALEAAIADIEREYSDPCRPKGTRPLDPRQPYRINGPARSAFIKEQFAALRENLKTEEAEATRTVNFIIRDAMREVAKRIAFHPEEMGAVEWRDLERVLREIFEGLGYGTKLTRSGKDGGFDLELEVEGFLYFVEVKQWSEPKKVGQDIIERFIDVVVANAGKGGLLLSTSGFTSEVMRARVEVSTKLVVLAGRQKLESLCKLYVQNERGMMVPDKGLEEILLDETF
ncbi:MAG: restriction endonuclease [Mesorhizobium sp.]|nr:MAG: restriction endonuclease [Mesorhizobium sp.]